jgi:hypothetical protein
LGGEWWIMGRNGKSGIYLMYGYRGIQKMYRGIQKMYGYKVYKKCIEVYKKCMGDVISISGQFTYKK